MGNLGYGGVEGIGEMKMLFEDVVNGFVKVSWWMSFVWLMVEFDDVLDVTFDDFPG